MPPFRASDRFLAAATPGMMRQYGAAFCTNPVPYGNCIMLVRRGEH